MLGYGLVRTGRYSTQQQQQQGTRTYALHPIPSSVPNPSASGPRMHGYAIRASGAGAQAVQLAPVCGLLSSRLLEGLPWLLRRWCQHLPLSVSLSVSGASSSRRSDSKSTMSATSIRFKAVLGRASSITTYSDNRDA